MVQRFKLTEQDFRGERFKHHPVDLKGNNDLLVLTRPDVIKSIHLEYLRSGADVVETNTFNATRIAQADYKLEDVAREINIQAARIAREACLEIEAEFPGRRCFVAGAIGPTNKTASISPDVNNPAYRAVSFDQLVDAYYEQAAALLDGGVDAILAETVFDTLNLKACVFALDKLFIERKTRWPLMLSVTITVASGRTLGVRYVRFFKYCRWMLRDDPCAHQRHSQRSQNTAAAPDAEADECDESERFRGVQNSGTPSSIRSRWRAHECYRLAKIRYVNQARQF
jgi:5-methyltetrahydrofolate--homocysteine methyltransferase